MPEATDLAQALRQCRNTAQAQASDLSRAKAEIALSHARANALAAQLEAALLRLDAAERKLAAAPHQPAADPAVEAALRAEIAALSHHRDEVQAMRQSRSWRITRPLRALFGRNQAT